MTSHVPPTASFSSLPAELRQKIWLATFEPRTLSLSMREHRVPPDGCGILCSILTFDVQLGLHVDQLSNEEASEKHSLNPQFTYVGKGLIDEAFRIKSPPGPVALEICSESREVALRHYELMFPSRVYLRNCSPALDAAFDASGWGSPHTWVNPKLDLIFLSCMSRNLTSPYEPVDIQMLWCHCKTEHTKLERVGVMSHNNTVSPLLCIRKCISLKELVVYLTDRGDAQRPPVPEIEWKCWDEVVVAKSVIKVLKEQREIFNEELRNPDIIPDERPWEQEIPSVQISQEIQWYRDEERKLRLRLTPPREYKEPLFKSP